MTESCYYFKNQDHICELQTSRLLKTYAQKEEKKHYGHSYIGTGSPVYQCNE
jgi:hypothetical protein